MSMVLHCFWVISALFVVRERRVVRLIINLSIFALISFGCFFLLAAPDVAMSQIVVGVFSTIILIVAFENYYRVAGKSAESKKEKKKEHRLLPILFVVALAILFIAFIPKGSSVTALKDSYIARFREEIGGENAVTAIYLGYRLYDTLFEALTLLVSIVAVVHLSWYDAVVATHGKRSDILASPIAAVTIRIICPVMLLFCVYLIANGHVSSGGGFQGGVLAAVFFVCRYLIHDIYDMRIDRVLTIEKIVFLGIAILSVLFFFMGVQTRPPTEKVVYLVTMNLLIGFKVTCVFLIIFYRFIAFERR